jgi:hypothetical protein
VELIPGPGPDAASRVTDTLPSFEQTQMVSRPGHWNAVVRS